MVQQFLKLEWKAFIRSSSFSTNIVLKIFMILGALYFMSMFLLLGFRSYHILEKAGQNPFDTINSFALYYLLVDLVIRFFFQKMPTLSIRPFLNQNIREEVLENHLSFWLNLSTQVIISRIQKSSKRPVAVKLTQDGLKNLIKKRSNIYSKAMYKVECDGLTKKEIVDKIINIYEAN